MGIERFKPVHELIPEILDATKNSNCHYKIKEFSEKGYIHPQIIYGNYLLSNYIDFEKGEKLLKDAYFAGVEDAGIHLSHHYLKTGAKGLVEEAKKILVELANRGNYRATKKLAIGDIAYLGVSFNLTKTEKDAWRAAYRKMKWERRAKES